jgi:uncharacterized phage protein (predicted DNA packaging)
MSTISEITVDDLADYLRLPEDRTEAEDKMLQTLLSAAKSYMVGYTGHTVEELDEYEDCTIVVYVLCQDMWDNRTLYVDKSNVNKVVESILNMHRVNLLPTTETGEE